MKKLGVLAVASLLSVGAMAGDHSIDMTGRMSWKSIDNDKTVTGTANQSVVAAEFAKVSFGGVLNSSTKYYMLWNIAQAKMIDSTNHQDATNNFIENFGIVKTLADGLTLNLGKQAILFGGMEANHSSVDQYITSNVAATAIASTRQFGAQFGYAIADQKFNLQLTNGNAEANGTTNGQSKYGWAASWAGKFGMVSTNIGYSVLPKMAYVTTTSPTAVPVYYADDVSFLAAGLKFDMPQFVVEADYALDTMKAATNKKISSMVVLASYTGHENFAPFAKFFSDVKKTNTDGSKNNTVTGFGLGVEYKESKADAVRYHVVYTSAQTKYETAAMATTAGLLSGDKKTVGTILVGAKFSTTLL